MFTFKKGFQITAIAAAISTLAACSTAPLICDSSLPTAAQINSVQAPVHVHNAQDLSKLPALTHQPLAMTFTSKGVDVSQQDGNTYVITLPVDQVKHVLAIQSNTPNNFAVYVNHDALKPFWKQAAPYLNTAYQYAVLTANHSPSRIVEITNQQFNGHDVTYTVTSSTPLPTGHLGHVTFTIDQ